MVVSRYIEDRDRFADEIECYLASKLNFEDFNSTYKWYLSQDHGDDNDVLRSNCGLTEKWNHRD